MLLRKCKYYVLFIDRVGAIDHVHLRPSDGPRGGDINNSVSVYSRWPVYCNNRPPSSGSTNNSHSVYSRWPDYARCGHLSVYVRGHCKSNLRSMPKYNPLYRQTCHILLDEFRTFDLKFRMKPYGSL